MTDINVETGLPEVPERFFWRIERTYGNRVQVRLVERVGVNTSRSGLLGWFGLTTTTDYEYTRIKRTVTTRIGTYVTEEEALDVLEPDNNRRMHDLGRLFPIEEDAPRYEVWDDSVTQEKILQTAIDVKAQWDEEAKRHAEYEARKAEVEKYLGDYPPKRLGESA